MGMTETKKDTEVVEVVETCSYRMTESNTK